MRYGMQSCSGIRGTEESAIYTLRPAHIVRDREGDAAPIAAFIDHAFTSRRDYDCDVASRIALEGTDFFDGVLAELPTSTIWADKARG